MTSLSLSPEFGILLGLFSSHSSRTWTEVIPILADLRAGKMREAADLQDPRKNFRGAEDLAK